MILCYTLIYQGGKSTSNMDQYVVIFQMMLLQNRDLNDPPNSSSHVVSGCWLLIVWVRVKIWKPKINSPSSLSNIFCTLQAYGAWIHIFIHFHLINPTFFMSNIASSCFIHIFGILNHHLCKPSTAETPWLPPRCDDVGVVDSGMPWVPGVHFTTWL